MKNLKLIVIQISFYQKVNNICNLSSSIAQLVEQVTVNHLVVGSSPTRGAKQVDHPFFGVNQTVFARNSKGLSHLTLSSDREFL